LVVKIKRLLSYLLTKLRSYSKISNMNVIVRRYSITNMFDATLATLGVILGSYMYGELKPVFIIGASLGAALGLGVSGIVSTYITERAERIAEIRKLERALLTNLKSSEIAKAHKYAALFISVSSGGSSALAVLLVTSPFMLSSFNVISRYEAFTTSIAIALTMLFMIGFYLGRISRENGILYGLITLGAGILVATILILAGIL